MPLRFRSNFALAAFAALLMCAGFQCEGTLGERDGGTTLRDDDGGTRNDAGTEEGICGDDIVDEGETCDPQGTCPTSCDDGNACTIDTMSGSAEACTAACGATTIDSCINGDGCCPAACNSGSDNDCSPSCGNGVIDPLETCDPPGTCPTSCNDGNACTTDTLTGSAANCSAACSSVPVSVCRNNDGCCPAGCNEASDNDCSPMCGNRVVESGETCDPVSSCPTSCDDGNACTRNVLTGNPSMCGSACSYPPISACSNGDGCCPSGCTSANDNDCDPPDDAVCGDAVCEPGGGELCTTCGADCDTMANVCGNGSCQSGETSANCESDCGPATWPAAWAQFEQEALVEMNRHRALGTDCPSTSNNPVGPLTMDPALRRAAQLHSWDQSYSGYFSHTSCNGRSPWNRAAEQGTSANGETIGAGQSSPVSIINGWLNSQGHCEILMSGRTHVGIGYAAESGRYWTAIFR